MKSTISLKAVIRTGFKLGICVLLGGMTTVAVTWGLAMFLPCENVKSSNADRVATLEGYKFKASFMVFRAERPGYLAVHPMAPMPIEHGGGTDHESAPSVQDLLPDWARAPTHDFWKKYQLGGMAMEGFGWPWLAGFSRVSFKFQYGARTATTVDDRSGILVGRAMRKRSFFNFAYPAVLPLRPIWRGIALNTAAYSAMWGLILFGIGVSRRALRSARGRCPKCAYDLKGQATPGCPECGWNRASP